MAVRIGLSFLLLVIELLQQVAHVVQAAPGREGGRGSERDEGGKGEGGGAAGQWKERRKEGRSGGVRAGRKEEEHTPAP